MIDKDEFNPRINIDFSDISSELNYFFVFPFSSSSVHEPQNQNVQPILLTYEDDDQTFDELMKQYMVLSRIQEKEEEILRFELLRGAQLKSDQTPEDLQHHLNRLSLNGIYLFIKHISCHMYECGRPNNYQCEYDFGTYLAFGLHVEIENSQASFYLNINRTESYKTFIEELIKKIFQQYAVNIGQEEIVSIINKQNNQELTQYSAIGDQYKLYDNSIIRVKLLNPQKLDVVIPSYDNVLIIHDQSHEVRVQTLFETIKQMTFMAFYSKYFTKKNSKRVSLMIMNMIITPLEKMDKLMSLFIRCDGVKHHLVGQIITEAKIFYYRLFSLSKKPECKFSLKDVQIKQNQNLKIYQRMKSERMNNASHPQLKSEEDLQSILIYTSELQYTENGKKEPMALFKAINHFLREQIITESSEEQIVNEWKYRYVSMLLQSLSQIQPKQMQLFRGIREDHIKKQVGEKWVSGAFTSASSSLLIAMSFAVQGGSFKQVRTIIKMKAKSGRSIKQMSNFPHEEEYLLNPYTPFIITKKYTQETSINDLRYFFIVYEMEEEQIDYKMPKLKANFVVWIDDKPNEGFQFYRELKQVKKSIILIQIMSTAALKQWFDKQYPHFQAKETEFLFITNMTREEDQLKNSFAGIEGMKLIRKHCKENPIFVYIFDEGVTNKKIQMSGIERSNIIVSSKKQNLIEFLNTRGVIIVPNPESQNSNQGCEIY